MDAWEVLFEQVALKLQSVCQEEAILYAFNLEELSLLGKLERCELVSQSCISPLFLCLKRT